VPVIGLGTWRTLELDPTSETSARSVINAMHESGAKVIDTAPTYGRAEAVVGRAIATHRDEFFVATKISTGSLSGSDAILLGRFEFEAQLSFYDDRIDLEQIHNLRSWQDHLSWLETERERGRARLIGATQYNPAGFPELIRAMRTNRIDAIQVPYNPIEKTVENEVLPLAERLGLGVMVMTPFAGGALMPGPDPARLDPLGVTSWSEALLKWVLSDKRIQVVLPATIDVTHALANAAAGSPPWFTSGQRRLVEDLAASEVRSRNH
jgi:aryl-alcohol dehydrogenase-like predicted oxidoreductase